MKVASTISISILAGACALACADAERADLGAASRTAPIINGLTDTGDPNVVGIVFPPPGGFTCTGVVVSPRVVLTAAGCLEKPIDDGRLTLGTVTFGYNSNDPTSTIGIVDARMHRYYNKNQPGAYDVGVILLASDAGVAPAALNDAPIDDLLTAGTLVRAVGFGSNRTQPEEGLGIKRHGQVPVVSVASRNLIFGEPDSTVCNGDSGGPLLYQIDGAEKVIGTTALVRSCSNNEFAMRTDVFLDDFIHPSIDAWEGPCALDGTCVTTGCRTADPDCDPCGLDGTCADECTEADWDCPLGKLLGEVCTEDQECETRRCVPATDDPRIQYCSEVCDPQEAGFCGITLQCRAVDAESLCLYPEPTPGAQGSPCQSGATCRSGLCDVEFRICVEECDPSAADACPAEYDCSPSSLAPHVCRPPAEDSGCAAAPARSPASYPTVIALLFVVGGVWLAARRKRTSFSISSGSTIQRRQAGAPHAHGSASSAENA